jgi:sulfite reductase alpha subunit-like flavoprotein
MQSELKKLVILYGSQTGNAQDLAERIWRKSKHLNLNVELCSFDKFNLNKMLDNGNLIVGVCSTTGQGDVPDNMMNFWRSIMRKQLHAGFLDTLNFSLIGLGDSSYDKYNFVAKKLFKRFLQLSAKPVLDLSLCDEQHREGAEGEFSRWNASFWQLLDLNSMKYKYDSNLSKYRIVFGQEITNSGSENFDSPADEKKPFHAKLTRNERLTAHDHFQDVRLIEFDCENTNRIQYEAGDVLAMRPSNLSKNVEKFLELFSHLDLKLCESIRIQSNSDEIQLDSEAFLIRTIKDLLERYFDLNSVPRMSFFEVFAHLATDELEKEKLEEFLLGENVEDLYDYCYRPRRNIIEVFQDFPKTTKNIYNLNVLLDLIPSIKPRYFSIASSPTVHKNKIQLLVAVVEYKTRIYETRKGTCSYWLSTLKPDEKEEEILVPIWIKKGSFKLDLNKPLICIGPGTGVAPFRSILYEKIYRFNQQQENYLFFGCRSKTKDYYFENEWNEMMNQKPNFIHVYAAFSRDQPEKIYVQDLMHENSEQVFDLIYRKNAFVLIAGNSKRMPQDVQMIMEKVIGENLVKKEGESEENAIQLAKDFMRLMEQRKQLQLETWS